MNLPHKKIGVAVIINQDNLILIDQRLSTGLMANLWEFPGGKWEDGETIEECIVREIKEELDITIQVDQHLIDITHNYEKFRVTLFVYLCSMVDGIVKAVECADFRWVKSSELSNFPFPSANQEIISLLQHQFSDHNGK